MKRRRASAACAALLATLLGPAARGDPLPLAAAVGSSLPSVTSGARPGPDVLYTPAPVAPQLENRSSHFRAQPLLVMGTDAYIDGEYHRRRPPRGVGPNRHVAGDNRGRTLR